MPNSSAGGAHALHIACRRHEDPGGAGDGLQQDRRDGRRPLAFNDPPQMRQRALALLFLSRGVELAAVKVGVEEVNVAAGELIRHPAPVAGSGDRAAGVAMIGTIGRQHLVAPGIEPRHANRVLIGIRPGVSEEHLTEARRRRGRRCASPLLRGQGWRWRARW